MPVTYNGATFLASYPQFTAYDTANPGMLANFFNQATLFLSNTDGSSPVDNLTTRATLLYMLTAHIAQVEGALSADGQFIPPGRLDMMKEGEVEVRSEYMKPTIGSAPWFQQTQNGAMFWQATSVLRRFIYRTQPLIPL